MLGFVRSLLCQVRFLLGLLGCLACLPGIVLSSLVFGLLRSSLFGLFGLLFGKSRFLRRLDSLLGGLFRFLACLFGLRFGDLRQFLRLLRLLPRFLRGRLGLLSLRSRRFGGQLGNILGRLGGFGQIGRFLEKRLDKILCGLGQFGDGFFRLCSFLRFFGNIQQLFPGFGKFLEGFTRACLLGQLGSLPDLAIGQSLYFQSQFVQFFGKFLFLVHHLLVSVFQVLGNSLFFFGCFFQRLPCFLDRILRDLRKFLLHGFVLGQFLFEFFEKFFRRKLGQFRQAFGLVKLFVHLLLDSQILFDLSQIFPRLGYFFPLLQALEMIGNGFERLGQLALLFGCLLKVFVLRTPVACLKGLVNCVGG